MKLLLIISALVAFNSFGQSTGLYGKKTILEVQGHGSWPIINSWFNSNIFYKKSGSGLKEGRNLFDGGVRVGVSRAFNNMFGFGVEYGLELQQLSAPDLIELEYSFGSGSSNYTQFENIRHQAINISTTTIMPKLEFSGRSNLLPIGLSHQIGVGYSVTRVRDRDYVYSVQATNNDSLVTQLDDGLLDLDNRWSGFTVMYQINMRTPITEQLMITYGFRYNANFIRNYPTAFSNVGELDMGLLVKEKRNETFLQLHFGMAFAF